MTLLDRFVLGAVVALAGAGCTPTLAVTAPQPIEININLKHEVRITLDKEVQGMLSGEQQAAEGVEPRGLDDDLQEVWADAGAVEHLKKLGKVGERADGYLGVVKPPDTVAKELADRVNANRRKHYQNLAKRNEVKLVEVEKLAGANRLAEAEVGDWILPPKKKWIEKAEDQEVEVVE